MELKRSHTHLGILSLNAPCEEPGPVCLAAIRHTARTTSEYLSRGCSSALLALAASFWTIVLIFENSVALARRCTKIAAMFVKRFTSYDTADVHARIWRQQRSERRLACKLANAGAE